MQATLTLDTGLDTKMLFENYLQFSDCNSWFFNKFIYVTII